MSKSIRLNSILGAATGFALFAGSSILVGCGGGAQEYGGMQQNLGGDISAGYNSSLSTKYRSATSANGIALDRGAYPMIETSFQIPTLPGDPFDYEKVNVQVALKKADGGTIMVPAFFDGGTTWRMRYTPTAPGPIGVLDVKLNGTVVHEEKLERKEWNVSGSPKPGFVRIDRGNHSEFVMDNGQKFFPLGQNAGWIANPKLPYPTLFGKMKAAGENWSRVWLDQRDGKSLDAATSDNKPKLGVIDLEQAKHWDEIISSAEKSDIYFQLVLENSGAFSSASGFNDSSNVHPTWDKNPLNTALGGMLKSPDAFFVDPAARALEKRKLYYILARWGYSPNIMGFELFHDAQSTDAAAGKHWDDIAMWHREMSIFIRANDGNHHLLTTSSAPGIALDSPIWETVDYVQAHVYSADLLNSVTLASIPSGKKLDKPVLLSEYGALEGADPEGWQTHAGLWAGLISGTSGGAQMWDWDTADKLNLYDGMKAASAFVTASGMASHAGISSTAATLDTTQKGTLAFGPGAEGTVALATSEFVVGSAGPPPGIANLSPQLAGHSKVLTFQVNYPQAGSFAVAVSQVAAGGAHLKLTVDGRATERDYPASKAAGAPPADKQVLASEVTTGAHTVTVENTGTDWLAIRRFSLSNYTSALAGQVKSGKDFAIAWIYNRDGIEATEAGLKSVTPASGHIKLAGLQKGKYRATWWDTMAGKSLDTADIDVTGPREETSVATPPIARDIALYVVKASAGPAAQSRGSKGKRSQGTSTDQGTQTFGSSAASQQNTQSTAPGRPQ